MFPWVIIQNRILSGDYTVYIVVVVVICGVAAAGGVGVILYRKQQKNKNGGNATRFLISVMIKAS